MITQLTYPNVDQYTDRQQKAVTRIQKTLEKGEERTGAQYRSVRSHTRQTCNSIVEIRIQKEETDTICFTAYMADISPTGMSFIFPEEFSDATILVGIPIQGRDTTWFNGNVVRVKRIPGEEFLEYGIKFNGRLM